MSGVNKGDKIIRQIAFYFSLALYFILLPIVLSYSLGYHIDYHKLQIYQTGILSLKSTPSGASIYINGKLYRDPTPARVEELKPGTYSVQVSMKDFNPWQKELTVMTNTVTRAENIILFPVLQDLQKVGDHETVDFVIADNGNQMYHMAKSGFYRSNMDGTNFKRLSLYSDWPERITGKKFSPDGKKFMYFNDNNIWVVYLIGYNLAKDGDIAYVEQVLKYPVSIKDAFWHSDSNHIVFVAGSDINVLELGRVGENNMVTLHNCARKPQGLYYDTNSDSLYFNDYIEGKERLYRIDLREKFFGKLMQRVKKEFDIIYEKR